MLISANPAFMQQIEAGAGMAEIELKTILDDVRGRDNALLTMLLATDRQAVSIFRVYVTLTLAVVSAAVAGLFNRNFAAEPWVLGGAGVVVSGLSLACWFCIMTIRSAQVALPGRGAEFWSWARDPKVTMDDFLDAYLAQSLSAQNNNHDVNSRASWYLRYAKRIGVWSVVLGALLVSLGVSGLGAIVWAELPLP